MTKTAALLGITQGQRWPLLRSRDLPALANARCMYHPSVLLHNPSMKMDRASQALAQGLPTSVPRSFRAIADHTDVPRSTLHARARGRRSIEAKAQSQQYLTPFEEKAMVDFVLQMSDLGTPVRIKYIPSIAFSVTRGRPEPDRPLKPPGKNWAKSLEKRHPEVKARKVKALDWDRHEKNIFPKIEHWFQVIGKVLKGSDIEQENVYSMDGTGVMLFKLVCPGSKAPTARMW